MFLFSLYNTNMCGAVSSIWNGITSVAAGAVTAANPRIITKVTAETASADYTSPVQRYGAVDDTAYRYVTRLILAPSPKMKIDISQENKPFSTNRTGGASTEEDSLSLDTFYKITSETEIQVGVSRKSEKNKYEDIGLTDSSLLPLQTETYSSYYYGYSGYNKINTEEMRIGINFDRQDFVTVSGLATVFRTIQSYPDLDLLPDRAAQTTENSVWEPGLRAESKADFTLSPKFHTVLSGTIDPPRLTSFYRVGSTYYRVFEEQVELSFTNYYQMTPGLQVQFGFSQSLNKSGYSNPFETINAGTGLESGRSYTNNKFWTGFDFRP